MFSRRGSSRMTSFSSYTSTTSSMYCTSPDDSQGVAQSSSFSPSPPPSPSPSPLTWASPRGSRRSTRCFSRSDSTSVFLPSHCDGSPGKSGTRTSSKTTSLLASTVFEPPEEEKEDKNDGDLFLDPDQSKRMQRYKLRVLRDLLKNFNIDERIEHYRGLSVVAYPLQPKDFSLSSAMEVSRKRERLVRFTGSDEVRVNDRRYMDQLCDKMRKESHAQMRKDEERRAEAERQRVRRLLAHGIITMDDMDVDSSLYREMKQKDHGRNGGKNNKRGTSNNKKQRTQSAYNSQSPSRKPQPAPTPRSSKASYSPPPRHSSSENKRRPETSPAEVESQMSRMKDEDEAEKDDDRKEDGDDDREQNGDQEIPEEGEEHDQEKAKNNTSDEKRPMFERYEDPKVAEMRDEESVDGLYRIADEIIIPTYKPKPAAAQQKAY